MSSNDNNSNPSLKLAIAMAMIRSKFFPGRTVNNPSHSVAVPAGPPAAPPDDVKVLHWKRKAKERKRELLRLKEDLKESNDRLNHDLFPQSASCKCYFFDDIGAGFDHRYDDVLRRRFFRQDFNTEGEKEQLSASVNFLVMLCDTIWENNFSNWSHQAVDFILTSLTSILKIGKNEESIELIINNLITRLIRRMCLPFRVTDLREDDTEPCYYVQHVIRKLGSEPYIGLRIMLSVSQRILAVAESLLFLDPFDDAFVNMHSSMFIMIQLIEYVVWDYVPAWSKTDVFDNNMVFEEWVACVVHARKALEMFESREGVYVMFMDRVVGEVAKQLGQLPSFRNLNPSNVFHNLLR